jgi:hypothetical protein
MTTWPATTPWSRVRRWVSMAYRFFLMYAAARPVTVAST